MTYQLETCAKKCLSGRFSEAVIDEDPLSKPPIADRDRVPAEQLQRDKTNGSAGDDHISSPGFEARETDSVVEPEDTE